MINKSAAKDKTRTGGYTFFYCSELTSIIWKGNTFTSVDAFLTAFHNDK